MIKIKRVYEPPTADDGERYLVDRLWPRGIKREDMKLAGWLKDAAPSTELREWYHHDPRRWEDFRKRYIAELNAHPEAWRLLQEAAQRGNITLVFSSRDVDRNNATVLKAFLEQQMGSS